MMESKAGSPARQGGPLSAIDAINVSGCGFSEELSRKVLTSLKGLTDAIATVRDSVSKIDHMAQSQNIAPQTAAAHDAASANTSKPSLAAPAVPPPALPQKSAGLETLLKNVCLTAAQAGAATSWDDLTFSQLKQVLDASSYATLEAARHSGASSAPGLSAVVPPPKGIAPSFLPAAGGSGAPPPSSFEEDEPMHSASVSLDAARSQRSGIEVVARPHDASPSKDAIVPASGGPRDPLAGDAEWPASVPDGPRFVAFTLRVVYEAGRTGFEEVKEFQAPLGSVIAGRYRVKDYLGSAAFSTALSCEDLHTGMDVCLKVIKNNKDFLDQSLDEIKLLRYINTVGDADEHNVLILYEYFYHKEHLILVTELLKDNLYEFQKYLMENKQEPYFTLPRLQRIAQQVLTALAFIHSKGLIHCDLKPENILIKSYSRCEIKVIDFGSSCYITDHLSSYIQSRSYRAPEVILGLPYDFKIDVWSLGCIMSELLTGKVLFQNDSVQTMLARMMGVIGDFPERMMTEGRDVPKYFNSKGVVFERTEQGDGYVLLHPKKSSLQQRLKGADEGFLSFVQSCLTLDPVARPSAEEALAHPWFQQEYEFEPYLLG